MGFTPPVGAASGALSVYERPYLYPKQLAAIFPDGKRWALCEASTKSGKTVGAIVRIIEAALAGTFGQNFWWVAPVSDQARIAFARVKQNLTAGSFKAVESPTPMIRLITGAQIWFKSADNPDSLYGEDVFGAVMDEASRARADAWYALRSTLTATRGWAVIIGNVKGRRNWFYEWARRVEAGRDPNASFQRITWHDACEAGVLDVEEIDDARRNLPESVFRELYEAEASDDGGNPFGLNHIAVCTVEGLSREKPAAFGVDLAKHKDYLVVTGLDELGRVCVFERWTGIPWRDSIRRIHRLVGEDIPVLVDSTGVGDPVLEELQVEHGNIHGYVFSNASKQKLMEGLAVSIQSHEIEFPSGPISNELLAYEYQTSPTGRITYAAPSGYNDDCVCSLALAREMLNDVGPGVNLMSYYAEATKRAVAEEATDDEPKFAARPWQTEEDIGVDFENELTKIYEETVKNLLPKFERNCKSCGTEVGANRVSDGEFVWHPACFSSRLAA